MKKLYVYNTEIIITRKRIKNMYLRVLGGKVCVSVPLRVSFSFIDRFVRSRWKWVEKRLESSSIEKDAKIACYKTGEKHLFLGNVHVLQVHYNYKKSYVILGKNIIHMYVPLMSTVLQRKKVMKEWYKKQLSQLLVSLSQKWSTHMKVTVHEIRIRYMKTRWGTCNIQAKRIWINCELIKKTFECIEYVFVHEMIHFFERLHNKRFYSLMEYFLPNWKEREKILKKYMNYN